MSSRNATTLIASDDADSRERREREERENRTRAAIAAALPELPEWPGAEYARYGLRESGYKSIHLTGLGPVVKIVLPRLSDCADVLALLPPLPMSYNKTGSGTSIDADAGKHGQKQAARDGIHTPVMPLYIRHEGNSFDDGPRVIWFSTVAGQPVEVECIVRDHADEVGQFYAERQRTPHGVENDHRPIIRDEYQPATPETGRHVITYAAGAAYYVRARHIYYDEGTDPAEVLRHAGKAEA
jgi:hypothetical protein